jgi:hypothetical protein
MSPRVATRDRARFRVRTRTRAGAASDRALDTSPVRHVRNVMHSCNMHVATSTLSRILVTGAVRSSSDFFSMLMLSRVGICAARRPIQHLRICGFALLKAPSRAMPPAKRKFNKRSAAEMASDTSQTAPSFPCTLASWASEPVRRYSQIPQSFGPLIGRTHDRPSTTLLPNPTVIRTFNRPNTSTNTSTRLIIIPRALVPFFDGSLDGIEHAIYPYSAIASVRKRERTRVR